MSTSRSHRHHPTSFVRGTAVVAIAFSLVGRGCDGFVSNSGFVRVLTNGRIYRPFDQHQFKIMTERPPITSLRARRSARAAPGKAPVAQQNRMSTEKEPAAGFVEQFTTGWGKVVPVGNPEDLPPCPSGVSGTSKPAQAAIFAAVYAGLAAGTLAILNGLSALEAALPGGWFSTWEWTWPLGLGPIFALAGVAHFTTLEGFCGIYPGRGAWGFWYLPGSASFHVKWAGIAEIAGGLGLALGGVGIGPPGLLQASAAGLVALTLTVTPANIYMFTHGAQFPAGLEVPIVGHAIRGVFQCVLLAFFYTLATSMK